AQWHPSGGLLAVGSHDGSIHLIDTRTHGHALVLAAHGAAVTSLDWHASGRFLLSAGNDWNIVLWAFSRTAVHRYATLRLDARVRVARFGSRRPTAAAAAVATTPVPSLETASNHRRRSSGPGGGPDGPDGPDDHVPVVTGAPTTLCMRHAADGTYLLAGYAKGFVAILDTVTWRVVSAFRASGGSALKEIGTDATGRNVLANCNDRVIRLFSFAVDPPSGAIAGGGGGGAATTTARADDDTVNRLAWARAAFSADGEFIVGCPGGTHRHALYLWDRHLGTLVTLLEGPPDGLVDVVWHPTMPAAASITGRGEVLFWHGPRRQRYSALDPGFREIEQNIVYAEREDEFDVATDAK
ncbi:hypothetical protein CXG81DRAFT_8151, partial [Caulochytrium protostelioides]